MHRGRPDLLTRDLVNGATPTIDSMASTNPKESVSFIGLGAMGFGMATNLLKEGYPVTGFDVYAPTLERFAQAGGKTATSPADAVRDTPICICMVATAQQAESVLLEGLDPAALALPKGAVLLLCSTVPCAYVQGLEKSLAAKGRSDIYLIDCPVSGGAGRAAAGTLSIMVGGSNAAIAKGNEVLSAMADPAKLYIVAGGIGAGSNMKMVHQVLAACQILSAGEAMGFAAHMGLDLARVAKAVIGTETERSPAWSWMFENRLPRMLDKDFGPLASALNIILKDSQIITSEARRYGFPALMAGTAEQVYLARAAAGFGPKDDSSIIVAYNEGVGKMGPVKGTAETEENKIMLVQQLLRGIHLCSAAESLAFAHRVGLDLHQVLDLCVNAAGGSSQLAQFGPIFVKVLQSGSADATESLELHETALRYAVEEAARLKVPLFLGNQALRVMELAVLRHGREGVGSLIKVWSA
jgi:3-hydroxyisobutyrate dehydrogenase-like beta-hydroxyacid dehydrogenase